MAARDGAASIQGDAIRITALNLDGTVDENKPILTTNGFISASFGTEFEDGDEISEKAADGSICIQYKASDSMKGITFNLTLCSPDPEASALIAGGQIICLAEDMLTEPDEPPGPDNPVCQAAGEVVGYTSPPVGAIVGNPIAVEIWSKAIVKGKPASCTPYFHWVFPYVRVRYEGDREFTNGALANEFSGTGTGNDALTAAGLGFGALEDFVVYKQALANPFSYVRTQTKPVNGWVGSWTYTPDNSMSCAPLAGGATSGNPGTWTPAGSLAPMTFADLTSSVPPIVALPATSWLSGDHMVLGDDSHAWWDSNRWVTGNAIGREEAKDGDMFPDDPDITASDSTNAAKLAGEGFVALPTTNWAVGDRITIGTFQFHWNGTTWVAGPHP